jgi:hypothetical protein
MVLRTFVLKTLEGEMKIEKETIGGCRQDRFVAMATLLVKVAIVKKRSSSRARLMQNPG